MNSVNNKQLNGCEQPDNYPMERYEIAAPMSDSEYESDSDTQRENDFGDWYLSWPPTIRYDPNLARNTNLRQCQNCAMKTIPTLSAARDDAVCRRLRATTRLSKGEIFLDLVDAPREEIRRFILKKLGPTEGHQRPKAEFLDEIMNGRTLLHRSVKKEKLDVTDSFLYYGADPNIEEDGQTIAHIAAAENNKLLLRILRMHGCRFAKYNSLGEKPLMMAIATAMKTSPNIYGELLM
ncbi:hypothetical protein GHT06_022585 [Daphnia sinensis]|uniref:Uncharacterized protein n=1 Tax=Daphnia sinensis TaxID=1820382 RepID=A0AAD5KYX4_9CRUS|nr:hypothetical protein GHT06_022585 [Daphnia sinensis]